VVNSALAVAMVNAATSAAMMVVYFFILWLVVLVVGNWGRLFDRSASGY
jgi:hypothetical protein